MENFKIDSMKRFGALVKLFFTVAFEGISLSQTSYVFKRNYVFCFYSHHNRIATIDFDIEDKSWEVGTIQECEDGFLRLKFEILTNDELYGRIYSWFQKSTRLHVKSRDCDFDSFDFANAIS